MVRGSILAVDDEEDVLELVRYNFNKEGFKVETATTGEEALKKAGANWTQYDGPKNRNHYG